MTANRKLTFEDFGGGSKPLLQARAKLSSNGRIVIPVELREALGFRPDETLVMDIHMGALRVESFSQRLKRLQEEIARLVPPNVSLADELIAERRAEARREQQEWDHEPNAARNPIRKAS